jgi:FkbM family methyltransferase
MSNNIFTFFDGEIEFKFMDIDDSVTVPYVWNEILKNFYGLNQIELSSEDLVIDVGANVGMFSIYVKKKFNCKVISFEPVPQNIENFKKNIELNGLNISDFEIYQTAISNKDGDIIKIGTPVKNSGGSSVFEIGQFSNDCETQSLKKYLVEGCSYLKIDCEGCEYSVIPDILEDLNNVKFIGIEYHSYNSSQNAIELNKTVNEYFKGKIFSNISDPNAIWNLR